MTCATLRTPLTVPRRFGGDTSERYRGTICDDAPTPTPVTSRPIVMAQQVRARAINVPIVNGTVVANSAALRPCASASGPMPRPPRKPPATSTETTAPSRRRPGGEVIGDRAEGALITLWYPNRNAPRQAARRSERDRDPCPRRTAFVAFAFLPRSKLNDDPLDVVMVLARGNIRRAKRRRVFLLRIHVRPRSLRRVRLVWSRRDRARRRAPARRRSRGSPHHRGPHLGWGRDGTSSRPNNARM